MAVSGRRSGAFGFVMAAPVSQQGRADDHSARRPPDPWGPAAVVVRGGRSGGRLLRLQREPDALGRLGGVQGLVGQRRDGVLGHVDRGLGAGHGLVGGLRLRHERHLQLGLVLGQGQPQAGGLGHALLGGQALDDGLGVLGDGQHGGLLIVGATTGRGPVSTPTATTGGGGCARASDRSTLSHRPGGLANAGRRPPSTPHRAGGQNGRPWRCVRARTTTGSSSRSPRSAPAPRNRSCCSNGWRPPCAGACPTTPPAGCSWTRTRC
ncbi:hypothetical protein [Ornithinimicrobium kibberense]|uniref:hypothetical protein n=1 Tax=Ornithinimicrobium kibberense TaxID=282060 RepID=UPI00360AF591